MHAISHLNQVDSSIRIIFSTENTNCFIKGQMQRNLDKFVFSKNLFEQTVALMTGKFDDFDDFRELHENEVEMAALGVEMNIPYMYL